METYRTYTYTYLSKDEKETAQSGGSSAAHWGIFRAKGAMEAGVHWRDLSLYE
jgi:hypothetical protein